MIIKEIDSIEGKIEALESLLKEGINATQQKNVRSEISKLKKGYQGEKQAAYYIDQYFPNRFIAHDLRLEVDGVAAQIDHIAINKFGFVLLLETKNFSSDVKIDDDGVFHYYDAKRRSYRPFPSPIEQSKRHEKVLEKVFSAIGFTPIGIDHIVVFDHKSKIKKPAKGFENVCYPDMIEKTFDEMVEKVELGRDLIGIGRLIKNVVQKDAVKPEEALRKIVVHYHKPITIDYRSKFSIEFPQNPIESAPFNVAESTPKYNKPDVFSKHSMLTLAKAASKLGLTTVDLEQVLIEKGFLERNEIRFLLLTAKGKEFGIRFRKGRGGIYFLIPVEKVGLLML